MDALKLMDDWGKWAVEQFGYENNPLPSLNHLKREIEETIEQPFDDEEYADMLGLIMSAYVRTGGNAEKLFKTLAYKLEKNKNRNWPDKPDKDGVFQHLQ